MRISDAQRIRVALAIVALKRKPKDVSIAAYVLDLRDKFPLRKEKNRASEEPWRERALKLEEEVNKLKRKYEEDLVELTVLRENARTDNIKKKKKLKHAREGREGSDASSTSLRSIETALGELNIEGSTPELTHTLGVFNSYHKLFRLSAGHPTLPSNPGQLLLSASDVLRSLAKALQIILGPDEPLKISDRFLNDFNTILCSTLSRIVSLLGPPSSTARRKPPCSTVMSESLDNFFGILASDTVVPLIKSFARISEDGLFSVFSRERPQRAGDNSDSFDLKAILHGILMILKGVITIVSNDSTDHSRRLLEIIKLSVVSEIERLWTSEDETSQNTGDSSLSNNEDTPPTDPCMQRIVKVSRQERIHRLARGTALWYLCAVAHDALNSKPRYQPETSNTASEIVQDKLDVALSRLLVQCSSCISISEGLELRGMSRMTDVEKGMIASVIENIWLSQ